VSDTITWDSRSGTENKIPKLEIHTTTHNAHKYSDAKTTTEWPTGHRARDIIVFGQSAKTRKTKCCTINGIRFATISHFKFRFSAIFDQQTHTNVHTCRMDCLATVFGFGFVLLGLGLVLQMESESKSRATIPRQIALWRAV